MPNVPSQTLPTTKSINKIKTYGECDAFATGLAIAFAYKGRANAKKRVRTKGWYLKTYNGRKLQNLQM